MRCGRLVGDDRVAVNLIAQLDDLEAVGVADGVGQVAVSVEIGSTSPNSAIARSSARSMIHFPINVVLCSRSVAGFREQIGRQGFMAS